MSPKERAEPLTPLIAAGLAADATHLSWLHLGDSDLREPRQSRQLSSKIRTFMQPEVSYLSLARSIR